MIQQNVKEITAIKCGNSECKKVYLNNQQIFPKRQDQPVGPTYPINITLNTNVGLSVSNNTEFYSHTPITVQFNNGETWMLDSPNSSIGMTPSLRILMYEDDSIEIAGMNESSPSISPDGLSVLSCTGKDGENVSYSLSLNYYNNPPTYVDGSFYWVRYTLHL